jgi:hypothetical protein
MDEPPPPGYTERAETPMVCDNSAISFVDFSNGSNLSQDDNLRHWVTNYCDDYLRVLVTREGFMGEEACCPCGQPAKYRCSECYGGQMFCHECLVEAHRLHPLCRIEVRTSHCFSL